MLPEQLTPAQSELSAEWDRRSADFRAMLASMSHARLEAIDRPLIRVVRGDVLEVASGDGRLLARLPRGAVGVDLSPRMAGLAHKAGFTVARAQAERLPFAPDSFDSVLSGYYSLRFAELDRALAEIARVLRPGGVAAFTLLGRRTVLWVSRWMGLPLLGRDETRWLGASLLVGNAAQPNDVRTVAQLRGWLDAAGLELVQVLGVVHLPVFGARRWLEGELAVALGFDVVVIARRP